LGATATGGGLATPIFTEIMQMALAGKPAVPFRVPKGISFVSIDRHTGLRAPQGASGTIMEAFKPGTAPPDSYSVIGYTDSSGQPITVLPDRDRSVISGTGGVY
jgi:penicillin-binding protein 1A